MGTYCVLDTKIGWPQIIVVGTKAMTTCRDFLSTKELLSSGLYKWRLEPQSLLAGDFREAQTATEKRTSILSNLSGARTGRNHHFWSKQISTKIFASNMRWPKITIKGSSQGTYMALTHDSGFQ